MDVPMHSLVGKSDIVKYLSNSVNPVPSGYIYLLLAAIRMYMGLYMINQKFAYCRYMPRTLKVPSSEGHENGLLHRRYEHAG